jgi:hypothetical protein
VVRWTPRHLIVACYTRLRAMTSEQNWRMPCLNVPSTAWISTETPSDHRRLILFSVCLFPSLDHKSYFWSHRCAGVASEDADNRSNWDHLVDGCKTSMSLCGRPNLSLNGRGQSGRGVAVARAGCAFVGGPLTSRSPIFRSPCCLGRSCGRPRCHIAKRAENQSPGVDTVPRSNRPLGNAMRDD